MLARWRVAWAGEAACRCRAGCGLGRARHCWVAGAADDLGVMRPGLLVVWREASGGWEGRVVYVARLRSGAWALVEEWLAASLLTPR